MLEAKNQKRSNFFTVLVFAMLNKMSCALKLASSLGKKATSLCNQRNIPTESIPDLRFGIIKKYPVTILKEVFNINLVYIHC